MLLDFFFQLVSNILGGLINVLPAIIFQASFSVFMTNPSYIQGWGEIIDIGLMVTFLGYITAFWIAKLIWSAAIFIYGKIPILGH